MRGSNLRSVILGGLLLILGCVSVNAAVLDDARAFIDARQYDKAIALLQGLADRGNASAEVYNELGRAYHWKKDMDNALKSYRKAAQLDKKFLTSPLPILDHFKLYDEIIQIGETYLTGGGRDPGVITGLLNAYYVQKNTRDYERVLSLLKAQRYSDAYEIDYQRYVLAKAEVRAGQYEQAIAYIRKMKNRALLQFMRTANDFGPISKDARFIEMTK